MDAWNPTNSIKPKRVLVHVSEQGKTTNDVSLPYALFKMGMKFGKMASTDTFGDCEEAVAFMQAFDVEAFEAALVAGEETLPVVLFDVSEPETGSRVTITLE